MLSLKDFLTISQAAQILGVAPMTLRRWDRAKKLKAYRHPINKYRLYRRHEIENLIKNLDKTV